MSQWRARSGARKRPHAAAGAGGAEPNGAVCTGRWAVPDTAGRCRDSGGARVMPAGGGGRRRRQAGVSGCGGALHCADALSRYVTAVAAVRCACTGVVFPLTSLLRACLAAALCDLSGCAMVSVARVWRVFLVMHLVSWHVLARTLQMHRRKTAVGSMQSSLVDHNTDDICTCTFVFLYVCSLVTLYCVGGCRDGSTVSPEYAGLCGDFEIYSPSRRLLIHRAYINMYVLPFAHYIDAPV